MSGISLCILGGTFASNVFYIATYTGSGSPEFSTLAYDGTDSYFSGQLSGPSGVEYAFIKVNNKGELQYEYEKYKSADSINVWSGAASSNYVYQTGYETASGTTYGALMQLSKTNAQTQWSKRIRNSGVSYARGVAVDSSDNSYVAGETTFSGLGAVIVKYNSGGTLQWQNQFGGVGANGGINPRGLALDSSNNVYVTGDGQALGVSSLFLVKYDSSGTLQWQRQLIFSDQSKGIGVSTDSSGNIYIAGFVFISGTQALLTVKYNSSGTLQWQQQVVYAQAAAPGLINSSTVAAVDSSSNVYVAGGTYVTPVGWRWAILKYDSSGTLQWQREFYPTSTNSDLYAGSIAVDNLGSFTITGQGISKSWITKFPVTGALTGAYTVGGTAVTYAASSGTASAASGSSSTATYSSTSASIADVDTVIVRTTSLSLTYTKLEIP